MPKRFIIEVYQKRFLGIARLQWQWRAVSVGSFGERLARGESYNNYRDMQETIEELFGPDVIIEKVAPLGKAKA